jgi:hypothetical protein
MHDDAASTAVVVRATRAQGRHPTGSPTALPAPRTTRRFPRGATAAFDQACSAAASRTVPGSLSPSRRSTSASLRRVVPVQLPVRAK